jgi:hypothetical protein
MVENHPKSSIITLKTPKKHYKFACFYAPQNGFSFLDQANWHMQKSLKKSQKSYSNFSGFGHLKMDFYFWIRMLGHFKNFIKILEISPNKLLKVIKN